MPHGADRMSGGGTPAGGLGDGSVRMYLPRSRSSRRGPRFYYVNGIRTSPEEHIKIAELIAEITESAVWGVYNQTEGMANDLLQCLLGAVLVVLRHKGVAAAVQG